MANSIGTAWIQIKPSTEGISEDISKALNSPLNASLKDADNKFQQFKANGISALGKLGKFGFVSLAATAVGALGLITSHIGSAVNRVDTLLNFPRVLESMGASSKDATKSTDKLSKSLQGLPTSLQDGANGVQQLVVAGLSVPKATDAFLALNDALIASGAGTDQAQAAMLQFNQSLSRGNIQAQEWNTLLATMPAAFGALKKETGLTSEQLHELYRNNPKGLLDKITELDKKGGKSFSSLSTQARKATGGIGTAWKNLGNSIDRGWQAMLTALGGGDLQKGADKVTGIINGMGSAIENTMKSIGTWINDNGPLINNVLIPALTGVAVAIGAIAVGFGIIALLNPVNLIIAGIVLLSAVIGVVVKNWGTITKTVSNFFKGIGIWIGDLWRDITGFFGGIGKWFGDKFTDVKNAIISKFNSVVDFIAGIPSKIVKFFGNIGSGIANAIKDAINNFLHLPLTIPSVTVAGKKIGGQTLIPRLATGGIVSGIGTPTSDSIPAMLSDGEYVIKTASARKIGYNNLDKVNATGSLGDGSFTMGDIIVQGYNKDPVELANEISKIIALQKQRVIG